MFLYWNYILSKAVNIRDFIIAGVSVKLAPATSFKMKNNIVNQGWNGIFIFSNSQYD
jgi:hypothetical protein